MTPLRRRLVLASLALLLVAPAAGAVEVSYGDVLYLSADADGASVASTFDARAAEREAARVLLVTFAGPDACGDVSVDAPHRSTAPRGCVGTGPAGSSPSCRPVYAEGEETDGASLLAGMGGALVAEHCDPDARACALDQAGTPVSCAHAERPAPGRRCVGGFVALWDAPYVPLGPLCVGGLPLA